MKSKILNLFAFLALLLAGHAQAAQSVTFYHHDALGSVIAKLDSDRGNGDTHSKFLRCGKFNPLRGPKYDLVLRIDSEVALVLKIATIVAILSTKFTSHAEATH
jgi:hypothetical protein